MKTEQINLRLEASLVAAIERAAREVSLDRGTLMRQLLHDALGRWQVDRALSRLQRGEISAGFAADEAGITLWDIQELMRARGISYPLGAAEATRRLDVVREASPPGAPAARGYAETVVWAGTKIKTLRDVPPRPEGVLVVGINPSPVSVEAGHYYQGKLGKRLWRLLESLGLLSGAIPGLEDETLERAGHGLTDVVKRPSASARSLSSQDWSEGVRRTREKIRRWRPRLVLFPFREAARRLFESASISAGVGPSLEGVPTFVLPGPYASRMEVARHAAELRKLVADLAGPSDREEGRTQPITEADRARGRIRLHESARRFFPGSPGPVEIVLRGRRLVAEYNPGTASDRRRSAVLSIGRIALSESAQAHETLRVTRRLGGVIHLD